jgi:hypothetical protein
LLHNVCRSACSCSCMLFSHAACIQKLPLHGPRDSNPGCCRRQPQLP